MVSLVTLARSSPEVGVVARLVGPSTLSRAFQSGLALADWKLLVSTLKVFSACMLVVHQGLVHNISFCL